MNLFESIYDNAKNLATYKHGKTGATRRFTGLPYIVHPEGVERILQSLTSDEDLLAAAWAHDLLEDTDTNFDELMNEIGENAASIVLEVTTDKGIRAKYGKERAIDMELMNLSSKALSLKLADMLYNYSDHADKIQKDRIKHHIGIVKQFRHLNSIQRELVSMLESMFNMIS
jgi:guanosine-3',5'-bis(diphosphate) 3'-pyrophosphohydrolase